MALYECSSGNKKMYIPHISVQVFNPGTDLNIANCFIKKSQGYTKVTVEDMSITNAIDTEIFVYDGNSYNYLYRNGAWVNHTVNLLYNSNDLAQLSISCKKGASSGWVVARMLDITYE